MLYTTRLQPRDKPLQVTRTAAQSASSRPYENKTYLSSDAESWRNKSVRSRAYSNKPNPIKHWRKQLIPNEISGTSSRRMQVPFNAPGLASTVPVVPSETDRVPACTAAESATDSKQVPNVLFQNPNKPNLEFYYHPERKVYSSGKQYFDGAGYAGRSKCTSCNPQVNIIKPTFGQTTKRINPIPVESGKTTATTIPYSFDTKAYLRSKQKSYETNLTGTQIAGRKYFYKDGCCLTKALPPSNDLETSSGVRKSLFASQLNYNQGKSARTKCCSVTYKPSNHQFGTQGSVSSSSRLERLKYNTLQASVKNPAVTEAWALAAANAGRYRLNGKGPYFMKAKRHICNRNDYVTMGGSLMFPGSRQSCGEPRSRKDSDSDSRAVQLRHTPALIQPPPLRWAVSVGAPVTVSDFDYYWIPEMEPSGEGMSTVVYGEAGILSTVKPRDGINVMMEVKMPRLTHVPEYLELLVKDPPNYPKSSRVTHWLYTRPLPSSSDSEYWGLYTPNLLGVTSGGACVNVCPANWCQFAVLSREKGGKRFSVFISLTNGANMPGDPWKVNEGVTRDGRICLEIAEPSESWLTLGAVAGIATTFWNEPAHPTIYEATNEEGKVMRYTLNQFISAESGLELPNQHVPQPFL